MRLCADAWETAVRTAATVRVSFIVSRDVERYERMLASKDEELRFIRQENPSYIDFSVKQLCDWNSKSFCRIATALCFELSW